MSEGTNEPHHTVSVKIQESMILDDAEMDACQTEPMSHVRQYHWNKGLHIP